MGTNGRFKAAKEFIAERMVWQQVIQRCPYTCVVTEYVGIIDDKAKVYTGRGFSKCQWPDAFDADFGQDLAWKKAGADIARQLVADGWEPEG